MPAANRLRVMIVDDQLSMRALVRQALGAFGVVDIRDEGSAEAALAAVKADPPHLILSDLEMPGMDGFALLTAVRAEPSLAKVPFIMLTGRVERDIVVKAASLGATNYLGKPVKPAELKAKIEQTFGALT